MITPDILLYERLALSTTGFIANITRHATNWQHTTRALGGYWSGDFTITPETMSRDEMTYFYDSCIGRRVVENTSGIVTWEGEIAQMELTLDGVTYQRTMEPERWHNRVKVSYTHASIDDINQGNLTYNPVANSFQDDGQDFSDWETLAGDSEYKIYVTNDDDSICRGLLGAAFTTTNANDSIYVYETKDRSTAGWKGANPAGMTPVSYYIRNLTLAGTPGATAWSPASGSTNTSIDIYGESQYIDTVGELGTTAAQALRDRRLAEFQYPKSIPVDGLVSGEVDLASGDSLYVSCTGYVHSLNRRYREADIGTAAVSSQISTLVAASEFVTAGNITSNTTISVPVVASTIPVRLWDIIEEMILLGDSSGNRWIGGVYNGRLFDYKSAATAISYRWRNGRLYHLAGAPVTPTMIKPDTIVQVQGGMTSIVPPGGDTTWDDVRNVYIEEVEFSYPDRYRLIPYTGGLMEGGL